MWTVGINTYVKFIMYFPVTSAFVMPGALFIGKAGIVDALIVIVLQAITALLVQKLVSMIYETIIMMNGSPIKLKQMIQIAKGAIADSRAKSRGGAGHEE
jgi:ABC-2 type transport system permease protein